MTSRHRRHTPPIESLGISRGKTWLIATDNWGGILESREIPGGTDLYDALVREHLRYHAEGWDQERAFYLREFYVRKNGFTPRRILITGFDPRLVRMRTSGHYDAFGFEFRAPSPNYCPP